jgi:hypothetical protein
MSQKKAEPAELPLWQKLTGLTPDREQKMSADERDAAIRILVKDVDQRARVEFERGKAAPAGERTVFWEPLERICLQLQISRTKLSAYSRELTGMRAHEICDRIKAADLARAIQNYLIDTLAVESRRLHNTPAAQLRSEEFRIKTVAYFRRYLKLQRQGEQRARWAVELGFPNANRLRRACILAHGMSIEELEHRILTTIVQKFCDDLAKLAPASKETVAGRDEPIDHLKQKLDTLPPLPPLTPDEEEDVRRLLNKEFAA